MSRRYLDDVPRGAAPVVSFRRLSLQNEMHGKAPENLQTMRGSPWQSAASSYHQRICIGISLNLPKKKINEITRPASAIFLEHAARSAHELTHPAASSLPYIRLVRRMKIGDDGPIFACFARGE